MSDLLNLGLTGLRTSRNNLSVTGHNISNLDTPGFTRQRAIQQTNPAFGTGAGYLGTGARTVSIERIVDEYVTQQMRVDTSRLKDNEAYLRNASELDGLLANENSALGVALNGFFEGVQSAANDPLSAPARELLYSQSDSVSQRFKAAQARLEDQNRNLNTQLRTNAAKVNELAQGIADINKEIRVFEGSRNQPPNDLFDRREEMLRELSEIVEVDVIGQDKLDVNVFIGRGVPLIVGENVNRLEAVPSAGDKSRYDVNLIDSRGSRMNINSSITGGEMGGIMRYRTDTLDPALNEMGRIALVFAGEFNNQHQQGVDLNGDQGGDFFRDINSKNFMLDRIPGIQRTAPAGVWIDPDQLNKLPAKEFSLRQTSAGYVLQESPEGRRLGTFSDAASLNQHLQDNYGFRLTTGGFDGGGEPEDIDLDKFSELLDKGMIIAPTRIGASQLERSPDLSSTNKIALAGIAGDENNAGSAKLSFAPGNTNIPVGAEVSVDEDADFDDWSNLRVTGAGELVDENGTPVDDDGLRNILDGIFEGDVTGAEFNPSTRTIDFDLETDEGTVSIRLSNLDFSDSDFGDEDSWVLEGSAGGTNGALLAGLQTAKTINSKADGTGGSSLGETYSMLVEKTGIRTSESRTATEVSRSVLNQTQALRESTSGVNMDEEAANLIRFQQAYQASTQVINTAQRMFDTLLNAVGR